MSTRCAIIVKMSENDYQGIYCHNDGYFEGVGKTLKHNFNSEKDAKAIIKLGDCSSIAGYSKINPTGPHSFDNPDGETIVAYHRDRKEEYNPPERGYTWKEVASQIGHNGYIYV